MGMDIAVPVPDSSGDNSWEPRRTCLNCRRPQSTCYCSHLPRLETVTRVVLLQHPRERDMAIGTARMANLCLPNSELHVGVDWEHSAVLRRALGDPSRPAVLLYPSEGQHQPVPMPSAGPFTLIVVDGTWSQARKVVRENPTLAGLPRLAFNPQTPSEYRIRREPSAHCVSTIEAVMIALGGFEPQPERFASLLTPFRKMIDRQIELREQNRSVPRRHVKKQQSPSSRMPSVFGERGNDLVCVVGEANAWPWCAGTARVRYPDELIHWVAHRPASGEVFELIVAPRSPLAPKTTTHVELSEQQLLEGHAPEDVLRQWRDFQRDSDIVCSWGSYALNLFAATGGTLPPLRFDLRRVIKDILKRNLGTLESFAAELDGSAIPSLAHGRAGTRLALLSRVVQGLCQGTLQFQNRAS